MSLLRAASHPNVKQNRGRHEFSCRVLPHGGAVCLPEVTREGYGFNVPLYARETAGGGELPASYSLISVDKENVIVEAVKAEEDGDGVALRVYECGNCCSEAEIKTKIPFAEAFETDITEKKKTSVAAENGSLKLRFRPFEIKTILLR